VRETQLRVNWDTNSGSRELTPSRTTPARRGSTGIPVLPLVGAFICGVAAIYTSTFYLTRFPYGEIILPWQFPIWAIAPFVLTGVFLFYCVVRQPATFWPLLVGTAVLTGGMNLLRFPIFDEWLAASLAAGAVVAAANGAVSKRESRANQAWATLFLCLGAYLVCESIVGILAYQNLKAVRYTLTFIIVMVIGRLLARFEFPVPNARAIALLVAGCGLAYYALDLIHGLLFQEFVWLEIFWGIGWSGAGNRLVVGVVTLPAALILVSRERGLAQVLGGATLAGHALISVLGDSRGGTMIMVAVVLVAPFALGLARSIAIWVFGIGVLALIASTFTGRPEAILDMGGALVKTFDIQGGSYEYEYHGRQVTAAHGDAGRFYYVLGAVETLFENPLRAPFGAGTYGYFPVAGSYYEGLALMAGVPTDSVNSASSVGGISEPPRPPDAGIIIAETGLIGMGLLAACFTRVILAVIVHQSPIGRTRTLTGSSALIAVSIPITVVWTYFGGVLDLTLFYLMIMPFGLLHQWGHQEHSEAALANPSTRNRAGRLAMALAPKKAIPWTR